MRVIVTGGAGFLGSHLCDALVGDGYRVVCVDNLETGSLQNVEHLRGDSFAFINHDITRHLAIEEDRLPAAVPDVDPHVVGPRRIRLDDEGPSPSVRPVGARPRPRPQTAATASATR